MATFPPISHTLHLPLLLPLLLLLLLLPILPQAASPPHPHMLVIMMDDLGYSDLGYTDAKMHTPHIDALAKEGVTLTNSYVSYSCTPSRGSFLTGQYAFRLGLQTQSKVFAAGKNNTLPLHFPVLSEYLKNLGYRTHYVGKWHLGFCKKKATPTGRGFETFYGMYNGKATYFSHLSKKDWYDFHMDSGDNYTLDRSADGKYSTFLFANRTVQILQEHNPEEPLFLFLSYQAIHGPLEVPEEYKTRFCSVWKDNPKRQAVCGMTAAVDEGIGTIRQSLKTLGYEEDIITLFISDNGGPVSPKGAGFSNYPLRGGKKTLWEGGTRVPTILHSKRYLPNAPYQWNGLMHAVDWLPTLLAAAGASSVALGDIDGVDNWERIVGNGDSLREEFVYNIDLGERNASALRWKGWKLVNNKPGGPDGWYNPEGSGTYEKSSTRKYPEFMLFDLDTDPAERVDLLKEGSQAQQEVISEAFKTMEQKLEIYKTQVQPPIAAVTVKGKSNKEAAWMTGWCE